MRSRAPEAIARFEEALRFDPAFVKALNHLGAMLLRAGRIPEAVVHFEAPPIEPDYAEAHRNLGLASPRSNGQGGCRRSVGEPRVSLILPRPAA